MFYNFRLEYKLNVIYSCDIKAELLAAIAPVFSVTWSFRNHSNKLIKMILVMKRTFHYWLYSV